VTIGPSNLTFGDQKSGHFSDYLILILLKLLLVALQAMGRQTEAFSILFQVCC